VAAAGLLGGEPADVPTELLPGNVDTTQARLLLSDVGKTHAQLFGIPTSKGGACWIVSDGPASCIQEFNDRTPIGFTIFDRDGLGGGDPVAVAGVTPDGVSGIEVVVGGQSNEAIVADNGFFYELANSAAYPEAVTVIYADGATRTIAIPKPVPIP
jgi:hypothetical protein